MKPRNAPAALASARDELVAAKARLGELEAKLTEALTADAPIESARKLRAETRCVMTSKTYRNVWQSGRRSTVPMSLMSARRSGAKT